MLTKLLLHKRFIIFLFFTSIISCEKNPELESPVKPPGPASRVPVAKANNDTTLFYPENSFLLDASRSYTPGGDPMSYSWKQLSGPVLDSQQRSFHRPSPFARISLFELGTYTYELTVTSSTDASDRDTITIFYDAVSTQKKVFVREYGTDLPVEGVEATICLDPTQSQCRGTLQQYFSDGTGVMNFNAKAYSIELENLESKGYWKSVPGYGAFYYDDNSSHINSGYTLSETLKTYVVPVVEIPVRVTDKRKTPANQQYFANEIVIDGLYYNHYNNKSELIALRPGIDTTFTIKGYGNMNNSFTVAGSWNEDWGVYPSASLVFESVKHITRNTLDTVYIKY